MKEQTETDERKENLIDGSKEKTKSPSDNRRAKRRCETATRQKEDETPLEGHFDVTEIEREDSRQFIERTNYLGTVVRRFGEIFTDVVQHFAQICPRLISRGGIQILRKKEEGKKDWKQKWLIILLPLQLPLLLY